MLERQYGKGTVMRMERAAQKRPMAPTLSPVGDRLRWLSQRPRD